MNRNTIPANIFIILLLFTSCHPNQSNNTEAAKEAAGYNNSHCCAPDVMDKEWFTSGKTAPLFDNLGGLDYKISTKNELAQKYFNQGLMLSFAFNHAEAARSFFEATRQDSTCALCWWGYAYVLGPNYNGGMETDNFERAYRAVARAVAVSNSASAKEKALIHALSFRYSSDTTVARPPLDSAYASAMRKVYEQFSNDATIAALFAESLMDLHPWDLFKKDGTIQPWTPEIIRVLKNGMQLEPRHAGLNHFYIHATEMSQHAEDALSSADLLRDLVPGAGHLVHMPSHTYIRIGRYHDGVLANLNAVKVDSLYVEACHAQGVYPLAYYPHNYHFLSACATLCGESKMAMKGARETSDHAHKKLMRDPAWATLQHYYAIPLFVAVKLGWWNEIREMPKPDSGLTYPQVIWHFANGMAALANSETGNANDHLSKLQLLMRDSTLKELTIWGVNSISDICNIAQYVLTGEIAAREKRFDIAISNLKKAVELEDNLNYDEPPDWFFSVRHHLGAVMVVSGKFQDAIQVYEEDLKNYPENGWALRGMMNAFKGLGNKNMYEHTKTRFEAAWKFADQPITDSRIF